MGQWSVRASGGDRCHSVSAVLRAASLTGAPRVTSALPRVVRPSEFSTSMVVPAGAPTAQRPHFWMKRNLSGMHEGGTDIPRNPTGSFLAEVTSACQLITGAEHDDTEGRKDRTGQLIPPLPFSPSSSLGPGRGRGGRGASASESAMKTWCSVSAALGSAWDPPDRLRWGPRCRVPVTGSSPCTAEC